MARGHKTCPTCKNETGPRTKVCVVCGHEFAFKAEGPEAEVFFPMKGNLILTPAGRCPVQYRGNVREWASVLVESWEGADKLTAGAVRYWLRKEGADKAAVKELTDFIGV